MQYRPISSATMMRFSKLEPGGPRCTRCGERFQLVFTNGRVSEQRCACGLVYSVDAMGTLQFFEARDSRRTVALDA